MTQEKVRKANGGGKLYPYNGIWPKIADDCFIAPGTRIIGDVEIGAGSSVWFNCVLRGDVAKIKIGKNTNVQDGSVIHVRSGGGNTIIGDNVLIGHMAMIHGCIIDDNGFVGFNASTMDDSHIQEYGMLAAGSLLSPGKKIGSSELWMGRPAKYVRDLNEEMKHSNQKGVEKYTWIAQKYLSEYST